MLPSLFLTVRFPGVVCDPSGPMRGCLCPCPGLWLLQGLGLVDLASDQCSVLNLTGDLPSFPWRGVGGLLE